ncbi:MAG: peptidoglycan-binding protein [Spirochaetaceae bacterium]|nr:peptidoglycan-binding protein [Spirochaetaceae bacterium]
MKCHTAIDTVYETEEALPLKTRTALAFHILFCGRCAAQMNRYRQVRALLQTGFFPPAPDFSDHIMERIYAEEGSGEEAFEIPGGIPTRGWVIVGLVVLLSFSTLFFGSDFTRVAMDQGASFLLPLGITIGIAITGYGALFIGSHLKELSERFKL